MDARITPAQYRALAEGLLKRPGSSSKKRFVTWRMHACKKINNAVAPKLSLNCPKMSSLNCGR